jgi:glycosyltransferase involved in cell wall biosynthesis
MDLLMKNVTIVQHRLLHYRIELFEFIKAFLEEEGIRLHLVHGGASPFESKRKDEAHLPWANKIKNRFLRIKNVDLIWQSLPSEVNNCDLLILMQENRILSNYPQIIKRKLLSKKIGYWGHGKNLQSTSPNGLKEMWKKKWLTSVDWWFAYTTSTVGYVVSQSFPRENITCLNNAIDVNTFKSELAAVTDDDLDKLRQELNIPNTAHVGVFCGSIYTEKRIDLMLEAIDIIKESIDDFYVVVIGDGPDAKFLHDAALTRPWLTMVGVKKGAEKALYYCLSTLMLNPGLVGLHILDSFCAGVPMITTNDALHSPEYDYLEDGVNGLVTEGTATAYANSIINLLSAKSDLEKMKMSALKDSEKYTVEAMAKNFTAGIVKALSSER